MIRFFCHFLAISALLLLTNCKKIEAPNAEAAKIFGKWAYKGNSGGFSGAGGSTRFAEGSVAEFTNSGHFNVFLGSNVVSSRNFSLEMKPSIFSQDPRPALVYTNGDYEVYEVNGDQLVISDNFYDGYSYVFKKL